MSIMKYLTQLIKDKINLVSILNKKGVTANKTETFTSLVKKVGRIETGKTYKDVAKKDINFYDYDGTRLYSYTLEEFSMLENLPELPEHTGLICQGWNWSFEDIIAEGKETNVGALYITDDGKTRIYIKIDDLNRTNVMTRFYQSISRGVEVDWGDGSNIETTGNTGSSTARISHQYTDTGEYIITLNPIGDCKITFSGTTDKTYVIDNTESTMFYSYPSLVKKVELGRNVILASYGLLRCTCLETITIPDGTAVTAGFVFRYCYSLKALILPPSITDVNRTSFVNACSNLKTLVFPNNISIMGQAFFSGCYTLKNITLPNSITELYSSSIYNANIIESIKMPASLENIAAQSFANNYSCKIYDFSLCKKVPTLANANAFTGIANDCQILVPNELYNEWISAANWSQYSDHIVAKSV